MASDSTPSRLLALPDPCLLAVMQCCADDIRSVLSAAMSHSRLQRAALEAVSNISAELRLLRIDSLQLYLAKHGQHVRSLALNDPAYPRCDLQLHELPLSLTKLDSLQLHGMRLHLHPGVGGAQGVLRAAFPLTWLELNNCTLLDGHGPQGLAAALARLPDLQHLDVENPWQASNFPLDVLTHLVQLTCLKLQGVGCPHRIRISYSASHPGDAVQPLQALTRLADLQLGPRLSEAGDVTADALSGADQLTRLVLTGQLFEPRALAGRTQLQHLTVKWCGFVPGADAECEVLQLLSELQHLTQLTHLDLCGTCKGRGDAGGPPLTAYASLTASSKLQHLDFTYNILPSAAWQHMCPPGRVLPQLQYLDISFAKEADGSAAVPDTSALVSCCPGLQSLKVLSIPCSTAQLAPLQQLTGLHTLTDRVKGIEDMNAWVARRRAS